MSAIRTKLLHRHLATAGAKISAVASTVTSAAGRSYPWNSQLRELANKSLFSDALYIYLQMLRSGATPNAFTFPFALKSSAVLSLPFVGKQLHCQSIRTGLGLNLDLSVGNGLLSMYLRCGEINSARKLFDEIPGKGLITWNAMINGYSQNGLANDVLELYREMGSSGIHPDPVTLVGVLSSCAHLGAQGIGMEVERHMHACGFVSNPFLNNALINMYARCGNLVKARQIFDSLPVKSLISWTAIIGELVNKSHFSDALSLYLHMLRYSATPNAVTFALVLKSSALLSLLFTGKQLHCQIIRTGCLSESFVRTSLLSMYSKCGFVDVARQVFDENPQSKELTSCYNALISGYSMNLRLKDAVFLFCEMSELRVPIDGVTMLGLVPVCGILGNLGLGICVHCYCVKLSLNFDWAVGNGLLSMYLRCGEIISGRKLFDEMPRKRLVTWNAIINGYAQNGLANDVLELYREMGSSGIHPNPLTLVGVLSSCANLGAHEVGMEVEMQTHARGFMLDPFLNSGLINMYARCGNLVKAREIFDGLSANNLVSWTAIIGSYGMHGEGEIAVELFDDMIKSGTRPDGRVFVNVLSACSHAGLTDKGLHYFDAMEHKYKLHPGPEHYSCMVDLLGRAGRLEEAHRLIKSMKAEPDDAVWGALLGACKIHRNVELAELAFERVIELEPTNIGYYVLLSNIYKDAGNSEGILRIRRMMRERKLKKDPGCSYVEFMGKVHIFLSGDKSHPQSKQIYKFLDELESEMKELDSLTTEGEKNIISDEEPKNIWRLSLVHEDS
ncbi:Putative pentatricopeptide repeat-containing protein At3g11460, mitochondrial [Linum perenne]